MSDELTTFAKIDQFIFKKIDIIKEEALFQKLNEILSNLSDQQQKIIGQILAFGFIISPLFIIFFVWLGNYKLKESLNIKRQIIEQIALLEGNKTTLNEMTLNYPIAASSSHDLENKIKQIAQTKNVPHENIFLNDFLQSESASFAVSTASIKFKGLGINEFTTFAQTLIETGEFKLKNINLTKDKNTNLLDGDLGIGHIGKKSFQQDIE